MNCFLAYYTETEVKTIPLDDLQLLEECLDPIYIFSLIWSLGSTTD